MAVLDGKLPHDVGHGLHGGVPLFGLDGDSRHRLRLGGEELTLGQLQGQPLDLVEVTFGLVDVSGQPVQPGP